jgi:branched-chain amino acid aminotransferase
MKTMSVIPFDDRDGYIWQDGELVAWRDAKVHVLTHGLHYASSVFEGERCYSGEIFKSREHTERLHNSAKIMGFEIPWSVEEIEAAKTVTLEANDLTDAYVRPVAWRGSEMMAVSAQANRIHLAIAVWPWPNLFGEAALKGVRLDIAEYKRPSPESAPCHAKAAGLYMICTLSKHAAEAKGYTDALMLDYRGRVAEATGANVFFYKDGAVHTPDPDCFLDGITRRTVIGMLKDRQIPVHERAIMPDELEGFEQCFLCGTAAEVTPVAEIGPHAYEVGDFVKGLARDYNDLVNRRVTV